MINKYTKHKLTIIRCQSQRLIWRIISHIIWRIIWRIIILITIVFFYSKQEKKLCSAKRAATAVKRVARTQRTGLSISFVAVVLLLSPIISSWHNSVILTSFLSPQFFTHPVIHEELHRKWRQGQDDLEIRKGRKLLLHICCPFDLAFSLILFAVCSFFTGTEGILISKHGFKLKRKLRNVSGMLKYQWKMLLIKCWFALKQLFYFLVVLNSNSFPKSVIANCAQSGISGTVYVHSIGQLHDDDIWLQLPEFISVLLCYLNLSIPLRIKEQ